MREEGREGQQEVRQMKNEADVRMLETNELNHVHNHRSIYVSQQSHTPQSMQESITHREGTKSV